MRPVHRLTPLLRFWALLLALLGLVALNLTETMLNNVVGFFRDDGSVIPVLIAIGVFLAACVVVWFGSYFWWKATGYQVGEEELAHQRGVFNRRVRTARYDRIQAVDVVEPLIPRLFGVAGVRVETAGGTASNIDISYLPKRDAEALRDEVLQKVRGDITIEGPAEVRVPIARSLAGTGLQWTSIIGTGFILLFLLSPLPNATSLAAIVGIVPPLWRQIDTSWRFSASYDPERDLLNLSYGLANRRRQAIPLARIHGVQIRQPMLWRAFGWWQVAVTVAGYGLESANTGTSRVLPVGTREQAMRMAELVTDLTRTELETYARPERHLIPAFTSPRRAWLVSPIDRARQSVSLLRDVAICHSGLASRRVALIHTSHIQELTYKQGPLQQLLRLSSVNFDLVAGPVRMAGEDLRAEDGWALLNHLRERDLPGYDRRL